MDEDGPAAAVDLSDPRIIGVPVGGFHGADFIVGGDPVVVHAALGRDRDAVFEHVDPYQVGVGGRQRVLPEPDVAERVPVAHFPVGVGERGGAEDDLAEALVCGGGVGELGHERVGLRARRRQAVSGDFELMLHVQFAFLPVAYLGGLYGEALQVARVVREPGAVGAVHGLGAHRALDPDPGGGARDGGTFDGDGDRGGPGYGDGRQVDRDQVTGVRLEREIPLGIMPLIVGDEDPHAVLAPLVAGALAPVLGREIETRDGRVDVHDASYPTRCRPVARS